MQAMQWVHRSPQTGAPPSSRMFASEQTSAHRPQETHFSVTRNFRAWTHTG